MIYYDLEDIGQKDFTLKRYDLIYKIDPSKSVETYVRENGKIKYNYDAEEIFCIKDGKKQNLFEITKYPKRSFTKIYVNELRRKIPQCEFFYKKTGFKEMVELYDRLYRGNWGINFILEYIDYYHNKKNTGIELLLKTGFVYLSRELFDNKIPLPKEVTTVRDIIKLPRSILNKEEVKESYSYEQLKLLEHLNEKDGGITTDLFNFLNRYRESYHQWILEHMKTLVDNGYKVKEILDYLQRADMYQAVEQHDALVLLSDYVHMAKKAELPFEKFPKSLKKSHDLMRRAYNLVKNEICDRGIRESSIKNKHLAYEDKDFAIILPECLADLKKEGDELHHCVASYAERVANGECIIALLRKAANKNMPFYTIEIRNNVVTQIKGYGNRGLGRDPKIRVFLRNWGQKVGVDVSV